MRFRAGWHILLSAGLAGAGIPAAGAAEAGYVATLEAPAASDRIVAHGLLWRCAAEQCVTPTGNSRAAIICEALAKTAGPLIAFESGDGALDADQLARCNAKAGSRRLVATN